MPHRIKSEVICDPMIRGGEPVIRGTRIPSRLIFAVTYAHEHPETDAG